MVAGCEILEVDALEKCDPETVQDQQQEIEVIIYAWGLRPPKDLGAPSQLLNHDRLTTITWGNTHTNTQTHTHTHPYVLKYAHTEEIRTCAYRHAAETVEAVSSVHSDTVVYSWVLTEHYGEQVWQISTAQWKCAVKPVCLLCLVMFRRKKHNWKEKIMFWLKTHLKLTPNFQRCHIYKCWNWVCNTRTNVNTETSTAIMLSRRLGWVDCNAPTYIHMTIWDNSGMIRTSCTHFSFQIWNADEQHQLLSWLLLITPLLFPRIHVMMSAVNGPKWMLQISKD